VKKLEAGEPIVLEARACNGGQAGTVVPTIHCDGRFFPGLGFEGGRTSFQTNF